MRGHFFLLLTVAAFGCGSFEVVKVNDVYEVNPIQFENNCFGIECVEVFEETRDSGLFEVIMATEDIDRHRVQYQGDQIIIVAPVLNKTNTDIRYNMPTQKEMVEEKVRQVYSFNESSEMIVKIRSYKEDEFGRDKAYLRLYKGDYIMEGRRVQVVCPRHLRGERLTELCESLRDIGYKLNCVDAEYCCELRRAINAHQSLLGRDTTYIYIETLEDLGVEYRI